MDGSVLSGDEIEKLTHSLNKVLYYFLVFLDHSSLKRYFCPFDKVIPRLCKRMFFQVGRVYGGDHSRTC